MRVQHVVAVGILLWMASFTPLASAQQLDWATRGGGPDIDEGWSIAVDRSGNSYVTGRFTDVAVFGSSDATETTLTAFGTRDVFVAKYSSEGRLLWVRQAGGRTGAFPSGWGLGIAVNDAGQSTVTGYFVETATFGPGEAHETTLTSVGGADIFVAKYDTNGALLWAVRGGGPLASVVLDLGSSVTVDGFGNSYVTGAFRAPATIGPATFESTDGTIFTLTAAEAVFVAKYSPAGVLQWVRRAEGAAAEGRGVSVDWYGGVYVAGRFFSTVTFEDEVHEQVLANSGTFGTFLAKYTRDGRLQWAKQITNSFNEGRSVAADWAGNSYVTGWFSGEIVFGEGETNETALLAPPENNTFLAKYDSDGAFLWARQAGTTRADGARDVAVNSRGDAYISGSFAVPATFGAGEINEITLVRRPVDAPGFVAKYDRDGNLSWARTGGLFAVVADDSGNVYTTGTFEGTATFGLGEPRETVLLNEGFRDIFVAKYAEPVEHRNVNSAPIVDESIAVSNVSASFPIPLGAVITATFTNTGSTAIANLFVAVTELSGGAVLLNGDGSPQGAGATMTPDVGDGTLSPGESTTVAFAIRLQRREPFQFLVNGRGTLAR
jgi:hypothetical protein